MKLQNKTFIFKDKIGYIASVDMSNANSTEEDRLDKIQLAAICRSKLDIKNPKARLNKLQHEAANNTASRPIEFIPIILDIGFSDNEINLYLKNDYKVYKVFDFINTIGKFSYIQNNKLYTNFNN